MEGLPKRGVINRERSFKVDEEAGEMPQSVK